MTPTREKGGPSGTRHDLETGLSVEPPEFPESDVAILLDYAGDLDNWADVVSLPLILQALPLTGAASVFLDASTFTEGINLLVDQVLNVLGDWTVARDTALDWANAATVPITIKSDLEDWLGVTDIYWDGGAFDAFARHIDSINTALSETSSSMEDIADTVALAIGHVHNTYAAALAFIANAAGSVVSLSLPVDILSIGELIGNLLKDVGGLVESAIQTMGGYRQDLTALEIDAVTFPPLPDHPETLKKISDPELWEVAPKPENPPDPVD